jgi:hypothetical protein
VRPPDVLKLGMAFPTDEPDQPQSVEFLPITLPMGWTNSPPIFCAATETIAVDLANEGSFNWRNPPPDRLDDCGLPPPLHMTGKQDNAATLIQLPVDLSLFRFPHFGLLLPETAVLLAALGDGRSLCSPGLAPGRQHRDTSSNCRSISAASSAPPTSVCSP